MPRSANAYLADILDACAAISDAVKGLQLDDYISNRLVRSSVEREFIIIGEALSALNRESPECFSRVTRARRVIDFRNQLTHQYPTVEDAIVWPTIDHDVPLLESEYSKLLDQVPPPE